MSDTLIPLSPETRILLAMKALAVDAHIGKVLGLESEFTVRHYRNREASRTERPCCGLRWMTGGTIGAGNFETGYITTSETMNAMEIDLVIDMDLPAEDEDAADPSARSDITGWDMLSTAARLYANLFLTMESPLRQLVDDIIPGKMDPDEESKPDQGRLVISLIVLYRTYSEDSMMLLGPGADA